MGRSEADKLAVSEADGDGPIQQFLRIHRAAPEAMDHRRNYSRAGRLLTGASLPRAWSTMSAVSAAPVTTRFICSTSSCRTRRRNIGNLPPSCMAASL